MAIPESGPASGETVGPGAGSGAPKRSTARAGVGLLPGVPLPKPTPLLDAALGRAEEEERLQREAIGPSKRPLPRRPRAGRSSRPCRWSHGRRSEIRKRRERGRCNPAEASFIGSKPRPVPRLKDEPQPKVPRPDGESDLVPAPLVPEPARAKPADPAAAWAESLDRLKTIARESATARRRRGSRLVAHSLPGGGVAGRRDAPACQPGFAPKAVASMADATTTVATDPPHGPPRSAPRCSLSKIGFRWASRNCGSAARCRVRGHRTARRTGAQAGPAGHPVLRADRPARADRGPCSSPGCRRESSWSRPGRHEGLGPIARRGRKTAAGAGAAILVNYRITVPTIVAPGEYRSG